MVFDTKIAIVLRNDLEFWQKLNVTAFLTSGIFGKYPELIGEVYKDKSGKIYSALNRQPVIVLAADAPLLKTIHKRAIDRSVECGVYIEDMFVTGHDEANRKTVASYETKDLPLVGIAFRDGKNKIDKITKGSKLHK